MTSLIPPAVDPIGTTPDFIASSSVRPKLSFSLSSKTKSEI